MIQSKLESLAESITDMAIGFVLSVVVWMYIAAPIVGVEAQMGQAFWITCIYTVSSLARRYITRRFFANSIHKKVHQWANKMLAK